MKPTEPYEGLSLYRGVRRTEQGTQYFTEPGVSLISAPRFLPDNLLPFLSSFPGDEFLAYHGDMPEDVQDGTLLVKFSGQVCYLSLGNKRTLNKDADKYMEHIRESGHGSILEMANYTLLFWGIDRSVTHEIVRHRAGCGFAQVSQRFVDDSHLRFVERPEYQASTILHEAFEERIDKAAASYRAIAEMLLQRQGDGYELLSGEKKTDLRKKVNQCARSVLPNETEAPIVVTANCRAWRHIIEMRANPAAEILIREAMYRAYLLLSQADPILFAGYEVILLPDGTHGVEAKHKKV